MNLRISGLEGWRVRVRRFSRLWGVSITIIIMAAAWLILVAETWAYAARDSDEEYDFNWLDPEKKIYVLQNRKFVKAGRFMATAGGGLGFSNPYRSTYNMEGRLAYFWGESFGIEGFYTYTMNSENSNFLALNDATGNTSALPLIREIRGQYGGMFQYVPWYAKINVFNTILHFDWYFGAGAGMVQSFADKRTKNQAVNFIQQDYFALFFNTGHLFHLSQTFDFRLDLTGAFYQAPIFQISGGETSWYSNYNFGIGIGVKL